MNTVFHNLLRRLTRRTRLVIIQGDITTMNVDAIVNAAKPSLEGGGGVDGAIHKAGGPAILAECRAYRQTVYPKGLDTGHAVTTVGGRLLADWVIHTVGPDRRIGQTDPKLLAMCYTESLRQADGIKAKTVAFPLISSGVYGWDRDDALRIAIAAITGARTGVRTTYLVLFDDATLRAAKRILIEVGVL